MCGIIGYTGTDGDAVDVLMNGLSGLEYRGYDSAGIALANSTLSVYKREGELTALEEALEETTLHGRAGIGHTRWSTHGPPSNTNAHPHTDCTGNIAVVHNGIIENYRELREELEADGHEFESETDTEVVPHLIEAARDRGVGEESAFRWAIHRIEGSYAVAAVFSGTETVYAARHESPLVLGIDDDGHYLASDVPAFIEYTDRVIYLDDGEFATIGPDEVTITDEEGTVIDFSVETIEWDPEDAGKSGYDHYMLKEIHEQPAAIQQCLRERVHEVTGSITIPELDAVPLDRTVLDPDGLGIARSSVTSKTWSSNPSSTSSTKSTRDIAPELDIDPGDTRESNTQIDDARDSDTESDDTRESDTDQKFNETASRRYGTTSDPTPVETPDIDMVQFVACGTSYHAALYGARLLRARGIRAQCFLASEYDTELIPVDEQTVVIGVTQSGETADTLGALKHANRAGATTIAVTNVVGSSAARTCDHVMYIKAGPEIGVAATKTFASQQVALVMLATVLAQESGDHTQELVQALRDLPDQVRSILDDSNARTVAEEYVDADAYFFIGRGENAPVALEGALKMKEISYKHAEGFAAGELKHGPLALVTDQTPVFAIITQDQNTAAMLGNVKEVQSRGAPVVAITDSRSVAEPHADAILDIPQTHPTLAPILANVQLQLVSYWVANRLGRSIDKPRNLAKSVTVT